LSAASFGFTGTVSGSNVSIAPSESAAPQASSSVVETQRSCKEEQLSSYSGLERTVIDQAKRYLNLYTAAENAFPDSTLVLVFIGRAWDRAKQEMDCPNVQMKPPVEKMVNHLYLRCSYL
jgi:hypothetical protein